MKKILLAFLVSFSLIFSAIAAGLDADTTLLMHMDGADNGTIFPDSSITNPKGNASVTADVNTKTGTKKWGTASALFDGNSGFLTYADSTDWDVVASNSDDWTIDFQLGTPDQTSTAFIISQDDDAGLATADAWMIILSNNQIRFIAQTADTPFIDTGNGGNINTSDFYHIAVCKVADKWGIYVNGTQVNYGVQSSTDSYASLLYIGKRIDGTAFVTGYIDELRIQKSNIFNAVPNVGETDTITVPTGPYSKAEAPMVIINSFF